MAQGFCGAHLGFRIPFDKVRFENFVNLCFVFRLTESERRTLCLVVVLSNCQTIVEMEMAAI